MTALHVDVDVHVWQALDQLEVPFVVRQGRIGRIAISTPSYTSLIRMTGDPVVIRVSDVYLLVDKSVQSPEEVRRTGDP